MSAGLVWQYAVIAVLVALSALFMFRKLAPRLAARWQTAAALTLMQPARPRALRWVGAALSPKTAAGSDCGDGCSSCGACGTRSVEEPVQPDVKAVKFHARVSNER